MWTYCQISLPKNIKVFICKFTYGNSESFVKLSREIPLCVILGLALGKTSTEDS